jgi:hypothetical protein
MADEKGKSQVHKKDVLLEKCDRLNELTDEIETTGENS